MHDLTTMRKLINIEKANRSNLQKTGALTTHDLNIKNKVPK